VIQTYLLPYDANYPVVCFDEACKQLFGQVRQPLPTRAGSPAKQDSVDSGEPQGGRSWGCQAQAPSRE
jgi:hypothetical protein